MNYKEVPHERIITERSSDELRKMIEYGHLREKKIAEDIIPELDQVTDILSVMSDGDLSHVLNHISREVRRKRK